MNQPQMSLEECIGKLTELSNNERYADIREVLSCSCSHLKSQRGDACISAIKKEYEPMCPYGYDDCICDVNYIKHYYPIWYESMGCPTECSGCKDGSQYDDEDK